MGIAPDDGTLTTIAVHPIAQFAPKITTIYNTADVADPKRKPIGVFADPKAVHLLTAKLTLESEEAQRHYRPLYNARVSSLGPKHIAVINATTRDGFDLNKRAGVTQISASNSNISSAANSPPFQNPISLTRAKEGDEVMHEQYAELDRAHAELDASR